MGAFHWTQCVFTKWDLAENSAKVAMSIKSRQNLIKKLGLGVVNYASYGPYRTPCIYIWLVLIVENIFARLRYRNRNVIRKMGKSSWLTMINIFNKLKLSIYFTINLQKFTKTNTFLKLYTNTYITIYVLLKHSEIENKLVLSLLKATVKYNFFFFLHFQLWCTRETIWSGEIVVITISIWTKSILQ